MPLPQANKKDTYADYLTWPESERWELIDGVPYLQSAPTWQHQAISGDIFSQFYEYLKDKPCRVFAAPFDLCISEANESDEEISNIISQPDIVVVCDESKLRKTGYFGVPSLIVEISSPSTAKKDKILKFNKFERAGVKEYWIVDAREKAVQIYVFSNFELVSSTYLYPENKITTPVLPGFSLDVDALFKNI